MSRVEYQKPNYPRNAFEGTAVYYARYRTPYPQKLFDDLISQVKLPDQSILLDLASGPGKVAIPLAPSFSQVWANDIDSEMVAVGKIEAKRLNVNNIEWLIGRSEELKIKSNSVDLITIGDAFHRLDQSLILDLTKGWLKPGAYIAIIGMYSIWRGNESWHKLVSEITNKWTPHFSDPNKSNYRDYDLLLKDKGFVNSSSSSFEFQHHCTIDSIVGYLYSTSRCSKKALGDNTVGFESELKAELIKLDNKGIFVENVKCGYTLGAKPLC